MYKQVAMYLIVDGAYDVEAVVKAVRMKAKTKEGVVEVLDFNVHQDILKEDDNIDECYVLDRRR